MGKSALASRYLLALSTLNPALICQDLPWSTNTVSVLGVSIRFKRVPLAEPLTVTLDPFSENHAFHLCDIVFVQLLGRDLLPKLEANYVFPQEE